MFLILMQMFYETAGGAAKDLINTFNISPVLHVQVQTNLLWILTVSCCFLLRQWSSFHSIRQRPLPYYYSTTVRPENSSTHWFFTFLHISDFLFIFSEFRSEDVCFLNPQKLKKKVKIRNLISSLSFKIIWLYESYLLSI